MSKHGRCDAQPAPEMALGLLALVLIMASACGGSGDGAADAPGEDPTQAAEPVAFTRVDVIALEGPTVLADQTVLTRNGRIIGMGASTEIAVPADAVIVEGDGRYLLPGLADMHVHMNPDEALDYVRHGITTVRNMWGTPTVQALQRDIEQGRVIGPTIYSTSPGLDGEPPTWPFTRVVVDPADAEAAVAEQVAAGWPAIKIYQQLTRDVYVAIAEAAGARGLPIMGHVPHRVGLIGVLEAGQKSIEHLGGIAETVTTVGGRGTPAWRGIDQSRVFEAVGEIRQTDTWVCPTLAVHRVLMQRFTAEEQQAIVDNQRFVMGELAAMNVGLLPGSDSGIDLTTPGESLHEELAEWSASGMEPYRILRAATTDAARFLDQENEFGRIVIGLRADLILVNGNPLEDLGVLAAPEGVMVRGNWMPASP